MHSPRDRWHPNNGNVLFWKPKQKLPSKFFVLGCRSDYGPPYVPAGWAIQIDSGHPKRLQEGIQTLWLDGHAVWLTRSQCCIASLYGAVQYGGASSSDGFMVPGGYQVTW